MLALLKDISMLLDYRGGSEKVVICFESILGFWECQIVVTVLSGFNTLYEIGPIKLK